MRVFLSFRRVIRPRIEVKRNRDGHDCDRQKHAQNSQHAFTRKKNVRLLRKNEPEMLHSSERTITTFWPDSSSFATTDAMRPSR